MFFTPTETVSTEMFAYEAFANEDKFESV